MIHKSTSLLTLKWPGPCHTEVEGFQVHLYSDEDNPAADVTPLSKPIN